jgi:hypothetical protein
VRRRPLLKVLFPIGVGPALAIVVLTTISESPRFMWIIAVLWGAGVIAIDRAWRKHDDRTIRIQLLRATPWIQALAFAACYVVRPLSQGALDFYRVAAELIPVLMIVLMIQGSVYRLRRWRSLGDIGLALATLMALMAGEIAALRSVFMGEPSGASVVFGSIAAALVGIVLYAVCGGESEESPSSAELPRRAFSPARRSRAAMLPHTALRRRSAMRRRIARSRDAAG